MLRCRGKGSCGKLKPHSEFYTRKDGRNGGYSYKCRTCTHAYSKAHYKQHIKKYVDRTRARKKVIQHQATVDNEQKLIELLDAAARFQSQG